MFTLYAESLGKSLAATVGIWAVLSKSDGIVPVIKCIRSLCW
jgi:hypothetical protein